MPRAPDEWNLEDTTNIFQIPLIESLGDPKNDALEPIHFSNVRRNLGDLDSNAALDSKGALENVTWPCQAFYVRLKTLMTALMAAVMVAVRAAQPHT